MGKTVKRYWHTLPLGAQRAVLHSRLTWGQFMRRYRQPPWCSYHEALRGDYGCWSLLSLYGEDQRVRSEADCVGCECRKRGGT